MPTLRLLCTCLLLALAGCRSLELPPVQPIGTVQGAGAESPLAGSPVWIEGVVTAGLDGADGAGGVFVQDAGDGDLATSDALFVTGMPTVATLPEVGQRIRVHGTVGELDTGGGARLTAVRPEQIQRLGPGAVAPATLLAAPYDWEAFEGMKVVIVAPLTLANVDDAARRGELLVSFDGPLWEPAERAAPGSDDAVALASANAQRRLVLDDGRLEENLPTAPGPLPEGIERARAGSTLEDVAGIVDHRSGTHRLQLTATPRLLAAPRPAPPRVGGDTRLAAFNVENLFNGDGRGGGFPTERGARTPGDFSRQLGKQVAAIHALDPHVAALMELENDGHGPGSSIDALVTALNAGIAGAPWRAIDAGQGPGSNAIRVGLVYRHDRVRPVGSPATLTGGPFDALSRVPLAHAFVALGAGGRRGEPFVVVANHFKSKGCSEAAGANADQGDGAACWNPARVESARRLHAWLQSDPTASGTDQVAILGDLNAYGQEMPLRWLREAGWKDAFDGQPGAYSYRYDGERGRLDHALLSPALAARLRGAAYWHANADEPRAAGYRDPDSAGTPWRSSDHDPLLLGLELAP
ncbi:ExeM/NucH family extracellular endonuclease [Lysobacter sp. A3-1-A15]